MCNNIYKLTKSSHLNDFLDLNYLKQSCCIFINNKIVNNKDFYSGFIKTLLFLSHTNVYISIYLINLDKFKDDDKISNDFDKDKINLQLYFKKNIIEKEELTIYNAIPVLTEKLTFVNNEDKKWLLQKNSSSNQDNKQDNKQDNIQDNIIDDDKEHTDNNSESSLDSENKALYEQLLEKKKLLENLKL